MIKVGISVHDRVLALQAADRRRLFAEIAATGLDHVCVADHVSFHGGTGYDGMVSATAALATDDRLSVLLGIHQAALRHPMITARQLASIGELAPGRLLLGVGVGGEDRSEVSNCGVDPATRGVRLDEVLEILRKLASGDPVDHDGRFYRLEAAVIRPAPVPAVPILVGGGSPAAVRRTARYGDGWLGIFCSARRFAATVEQVRAEAAELRRSVDWFGLQLWCGLDDDPDRARVLLADRMEGLYGLPYERFARIAPAGTTADVADFLAPFVEAGARHLTLVASASDTGAAVAQVAEVQARLHRMFGDDAQD